ncbi:MAG: prephenate dehydrogenase, partial [Bacilli bacterium]|nr:prephenate dehydrogenase [Bacilli bacterium]
MNIGIVGLGLIGGSIAMKLREKNTIHAFDISSASLEYALENKIVHQVYSDVEKFLPEVEVIFLALYPNDCKTFLVENMAAFRPGTIIIEISGIKSGLVKTIAPVLRDDIDVIFTHPIAGREKIGVFNSLERLFDGQNFVIVKTPTNRIHALNKTEKLVKDLGFKNITYLSSEEHDEIIAYTSQLAHVMALALMDSDGKNYDTGKLIGDSFRDLTRIAMINEDLWSELLIENKKYLS